MEEGKTIRVAQIMGKMVGGGVETFVMNYYRNMDKNKVQFDFFVDEDSTYVPREKIEKMGGKIITIPPYQKTFKYVKTLIKKLKEGKYKIVHSNLNALSVFPLFCAKVARVPVRIAHSHSTTNKKEWKKNILKNILKPFSKLFANEYFCCTEYAGKWLFGKRFFEKGKVKVINNAIDVEKFDYNEEIRKKVRKELNIEGKFVVGHVGRFITQKNHERIIDIFNVLHKEKRESILLLVGEGKLEKTIKEKVRQLGIEDSVIFLGIREDVNELFQAMDVFLFPSLYEGLGIVLIEAQAAGLPCVVSTEVPKVAKVTDIVEFMNLDDNNEMWCEKIIETSKKNERKGYIDFVEMAGYDIKKESKKLQEFYLNVI